MISLDDVQHVDACQGRCGPATFTCRECRKPSGRCAADVALDDDAEQDANAACVTCGTKIQLGLGKGLS